MKIKNLLSQLIISYNLILQQIVNTLIQTIPYLRMENQSPLIYHHFHFMMMIN